MNPTLKIRYIAKKTAIFTSAAALGMLALVGCAPTTPSAKVEPTQPEEQPATKAQSPTLKNLEMAYNGESNAHVMYLDYAKKADEEGYKGVASLFRAAARAEEIHKENHAKVIKEMGGTPQNTIATPEVKSTQENLQHAIKGESYERDTMYPDFIKEAKAKGEKNAVQTFTYAGNAEAGHAKLYTEALNNLDAWKAPKQFYVCSVSGQTAMNANETNCTVDGVKKPVEEVR
ncbi:rubrerythrin [Hydrococcus rivularis NIES-593]|uniref:Rubrerythrin n=1 Tax=Hydrococcus rivularis NIES-593 TaxID=1921803 RepID=A0A1U7HDI0_9CYAN|nr:rubrerythrin family protein [Hydrococcus rivularis]OKH21601.1 rubrerythrin [Hydrococcus rivularis NIES-593]